MSGKPTSTTPLPKSGKRQSRAPSPTGDSSDSLRSRSLSAGKSSSRKLADKTKKSAAAQSKWTPSQYISSTSEDESVAADSVSSRTRFRRSREIKEMAKKELEPLSNYKIPKKSGEKALKDIQYNLKKNQSQTYEDLVFGSSGKVLGYKYTSVHSSHSSGNAERPKIEVTIPMRSSLGNGTYLPVVESCPGSGRRSVPPGVGKEVADAPFGAPLDRAGSRSVKAAPYPKSKPSPAKEADDDVASQAGIKVPSPSKVGAEGVTKPLVEYELNLSNQDDEKLDYEPDVDEEEEEEENKEVKNDHNSGPKNKGEGGKIK